MTTQKEMRRRRQTARLLKHLEKTRKEAEARAALEKKPTPIRKIRKVPKGSEKIKKIVIDLDGPDGNAFYLLGLAKKWSNQLDLNWGLIYEEMTASDYSEMIKVFKKHFGMFATLYHGDME